MQPPTTSINKTTPAEDYNPVKWFVIGASFGVLVNLLTIKEGEAEKTATKTKAK